MNLETLSSSLLFIGPCIIVLYFTFSDRLKAPTLLTVASGIAIFVAIDIALTYIYMTTPLTALYNGFTGDLRGNGRRIYL